MFRHIDYIIHDVTVNVVHVLLTFLGSLCFSLQKYNHLIFTFARFYFWYHKE